MEESTQYQAIVIGASTGALDALRIILAGLPSSFDLAVLIAVHRLKGVGDMLCGCLSDYCQLTVKEAEDKQTIHPGIIYIAPADYHMQVEPDKTISLSVDPLVNWSRPSIDILFETAAESYRNGLIGVILTGANQDGSKGLKAIKELGGLTLIQDPKTAVSPEMPSQAIAEVGNTHILTLQGITNTLADIKGVRTP